MTRTSEDLAALVLAGDGYTETVNVEYIGENFAVVIRPLSELEMKQVNRQVKVSMKLFSSLQGKIKAGQQLTEKEMEAAKEAAVDQLLSSDNVEIGELDYTNFVLNKLYCQHGIVSENLKTLVPKFRWGLTELIASRIQTISNVPPEVVANFFGQKADSKSSS